MRLYLRLCPESVLQHSDYLQSGVEIKAATDKTDFSYKDEGERLIVEPKHMKGRHNCKDSSLLLAFLARHQLVGAYS